VSGFIIPNYFEAHNFLRKNLSVEFFDSLTFNYFDQVFYLFNKPHLFKQEQDQLDFADIVNLGFDTSFWDQQHTIEWKDFINRAFYLKNKGQDISFDNISALHRIPGTYSTITSRAPTPQNTSKATIATVQSNLSSTKAHTMTTQSPSKDTVAKPTPFSGRRSDTESFLFQLDLLFQGNPTKYNTDQIKISTALSYMKTGVAADWARDWHNKNIDATTNTYAPTWPTFRQALAMRFEAVNEKELSQDIIQNMRATKGINQYVEDFNRIADKANFDEKANIAFFKRGLPRWCLDKIMDLDSSIRPDTLAKWQEKALRYEAEKKGYNYNYQSYSTADFMGEPMDIDRIQPGFKLNEAERRKRRENGQCFYCGERNHFARNCPKAPKGFRSRGSFRGRGRGNYRNAKPVVRNRQAELEDAQIQAEESLPTPEQIGKAIANADEDQMRQIKNVLKEVSYENQDF
jgi:hypothetical protein